MSIVFKNETDDSVIAEYIIERDASGEVIRSFEQPGNSRSEAVALLSHVIDKSSLLVDEKEIALDEVRKYLKQLKEVKEVSVPDTKQSVSTAKSPDTIPSRTKTGRRIKKDTL